MAIEVVVVDDLRTAAQEYARLIELQTTLSTKATDDPAEAVELVRKNPIRVAVLDQRMPGKSGTDLFLDMRRIDPGIKAIMLTGEALAHEVGEALKIGFANYLHKSQVQDLPAQVLLHYAQYEVDLAKRGRDHRPAQLYKERRGFGLGHHIELTLVGTRVLDEDYIFAGSWITAKQLSAGEHIKEVDTIDITNRYSHEVEVEKKLASTFGLSAARLLKLQTELEGAISSRYTDQVFSEHRHSLKVEREYKLPDEPTSPDDLHVASRHFQRAPVYRAIRCLLVKTCSCCQSKEPFVLVLCQLTSKIATQQCDYLSDGTKRILETGSEVY